MSFRHARALWKACIYSLATPHHCSLKHHVVHSQAELQHLDETDVSTAEAVQSAIDNMVVCADRTQFTTKHGRTVATDVLDIAAPLNDAIAAIVDDSFLRCFKSAADEPWNWNFYLMPLWATGVLIRNFILFPLRLISLLLTFLLYFLLFAMIGLFLKGNKRKIAERRAIKFLAQGFVFSWTGVINYHGPRPVAAPGRVWVANHTSMIDYAVLCAHTPFAAIMQLHPGWVGYIQKKYLGSLGCLWFNRTQSKDRSLVARKMKEHVYAEGATPLLIFPEGTCVNNEYCVMFKRGAFDLDATVCPVAIKYNKIFVDAFWNSKRQSFTAHLAKIMRSWALVCDVYFLEPQKRKKGESAQEFAERVQHMIANKAGLKVAPWDGYLKYYNLADKHPDLIDKQRKVYADQLRHYL